MMRDRTELVLFVLLVFVLLVLVTAAIAVATFLQIRSMF